MSNPNNALADLRAGPQNHYTAWLGARRERDVAEMQLAWQNASNFGRDKAGRFGAVYGYAGDERVGPIHPLPLPWVLPAYKRMRWFFAH